MVENCTEALHTCLEEASEEDKQMFAAMVWAMLPNALSKTLIDYETEIGTYWKHFVRIKRPGFYLHARKNA